MTWYLRYILTNNLIGYISTLLLQIKCNLNHYNTRYYSSIMLPKIDGRTTPKYQKHNNVVIVC